MLPYLVARARWTTFALLVACSFDGSGLDSAGPPGSSTSTTGDSSTSTGPTAPTTSTSAGPGGSDSDSDSDSTTAPVDPTSSTSTTTTSTTDTTTTTEPDTTTTTEPDTTTTTSTDTSTSTGPDTTTGVMCMSDDTEPNEDEGSAIDLGNQGCKADPKSFTGTLDGEGDVDWFRYKGQFGGNGCGGFDPDPVAAIVLTAADTLEVCLFVDCDNGNANPNCPQGTTDADSPSGHPGCCGSGNIQYTVDCSGGGNESSTLYVRLRNAPADACLDYQVNYSYHN